MGNRSTKSSSMRIARPLAVVLGAILLAAQGVSAVTDDTRLFSYANKYSRYTENDTPANTVGAVPLYRASTIGSPTADTTASVLLLHEGAATANQMTWADLGQPSNYDDIFDMVFRAHTRGVAQGGLTAVPTFEDTDPWPVLMVAPSAGQLHQVPVGEIDAALGDPLLSSATSIFFPAANKWCQDQGAAGGWPTGNSASDAGGVRTTVELVCINSDQGHVAEIPYYVLEIYHFNVDPFPENRRDLLWTHLTAIAEAIAPCTWLQDTWKGDLKQLFFDTAFAFYELAPATAGSSAPILHSTNSYLELTLTDHSTDRTGPVDFRNIIAHGLMEALNFAHPDATHEGAGWAAGNWACTADGSGTPFPAYFQSAPLQIECCFPGSAQGAQPTFNGRADTNGAVEPVDPGTVGSTGVDNGSSGSDGSSGGDDGSSSGAVDGGSSGAVDGSSSGAVDGGSSGAVGSSSGAVGDGSCTFPTIPAGFGTGTCSGASLANGETCTLSVSNPLLDFVITYTCTNGQIQVTQVPIVPGGSTGGNGGKECTLPSIPSGFTAITCTSNTLRSGASCIIASRTDLGTIITYSCDDGSLSQEESDIGDGIGGKGAAAFVQPMFGAMAAMVAVAVAAIMV